MSKIYSLAIFQRVQGKIIRICPVRTDFFTTRKREAMTAARRYMRSRPGFDSDKWVAPEIL